jgi:hypothetical protein
VWGTIDPDLRPTVCFALRRTAEYAFRPLAISDDRLIVARMGDKSPKSKQRDQKQKNAAKATNAAQAKAKQDGYGRPEGFAPKGRG